MREAISKELRQAIFTRDNYTCQYCGGTSDEADLVIEHIIPVSKGGNNDARNLCTSCSKCNSSKGSRILTISELRTIADKINSSLEYLMSIAEEEPKEIYSKRVQVSVYLEPNTYEALQTLSIISGNSVSDMLSKAGDELAQKNYNTAMQVRERLQGFTMEY